MIHKWFFSAIQIISSGHDVSISYLLYALINLVFPQIIRGKLPPQKTNFPCLQVLYNSTGWTQIQQLWYYSTSNRKSMSSVMFCDLVHHDFFFLIVSNTLLNFVITVIYHFFINDIMIELIIYNCYGSSPYMKDRIV